MAALRRITCRVSLNNGLKYLDLARALYTQVSPDSVFAIQPLSQILYQVTFKNEKFFKKAMDHGLVHIDGEDFEFVPVDGLTRWIHVRDVPVWVEKAAFVAAFSPYGEVLNYEEEEWPQLKGVKNGSRRLQIKMLVQNGVPNILKVGQNHRARVFYPGVEFLCFKCKQKGHKFAECPQRTHSEIAVQPSTSSAETPQVTPPVTEDLSDNVNPATEIPYSPSETPPSKPQMRRWCDPLDEPATNKIPNHDNIPPKDILPAGSFGLPFAESIDHLSLAALEQLINGTLPRPTIDYEEDPDSDTSSPTKLTDLIQHLPPTTSNRPLASPAKRRSDRPHKTNLGQPAKKSK